MKKHAVVICFFTILGSIQAQNDDIKLEDLGLFYKKFEKIQIKKESYLTPKPEVTIVKEFYYDTLNRLAEERYNFHNNKTNKPDYESKNFSYSSSETKIMHKDYAGVFGVFQDTLAEKLRFSYCSYDNKGRLSLKKEIFLGATERKTVYYYNDDDNLLGIEVSINEKMIAKYIIEYTVRKKRQG